MSDTFVNKIIFQFKFISYIWLPGHKSNLRFNDNTENVINWAASRLSAVKKLLVLVISISVI